jgi:hypothetical protein
MSDGIKLEAVNTIHPIGYGIDRGLVAKKDSIKLEMDDKGNVLVSRTKPNKDGKPETKVYLVPASNIISAIIA